MNELAAGISRRSLLSAPLALAGCNSLSRNHFGQAKPRSRQRLVFLNGPEPATLDPALEASAKEANIVCCLFEGLTRNHPLTLEPVSALATHYESSDGGKVLTFYLRGHCDPRGLSLPGSERANCRNFACWSDGTPITAHDFIYSWRRLADPHTAGPLAHLLFYVEGAEEIYSGRRATKDLAVEAPNDFTLRVGLRSPVPFFLQIAAAAPLAAVPCQAIRAARDRGEESSWTRPGRIVVSGPFRLQEWRSYDRVVLRRNPSYYNAERLLLDELSFVHIADGVTNVSLYKAGEADAMADSILPPQFLPALQRVGELHVLPALDNYYYFVNLNKPPLNNVLLRYALNMALDKNALATFAGVGRTPAKNFVPPIAGYPAPQKLNVNVNGRECDVLSYNPPTARELLAAAGLAAGVCPNGRRLRLNLSYWNRPMSRERCEILQQVWHRNLGIELSLVALELPVWLQSVTSGEYEGLADVDWNADYADQDAFLSLLTSSSPANGSGWRDPAYDAMLASANTETDLAVRMRKLVDCEEYMLRRMPVIPLYFDAWTYLQKPFVRDLYIDPLARVTFPSAWIDTKWRPS